jgi:Double zinc ribbon
MHCPSCGFENPEGLKFYNDCGTPLRLRCAQCGFANQPQAKFCGECGAALLPEPGVSSAPSVAPCPLAPLSYTPTYLAERILTSKTALVGERKQVTVLFADLKGSMELLADRDPEEARAILDPVLECMMAAVHRYEGTVNQVMDDGIMALFGAPLRTKTMRYARAMRRSPCRTPSAITVTRCAAPTASKSTSGWG